jgi:hypothetical protein
MIVPIYDAFKRLRESPHANFKRRKSEHQISINDLLASDNIIPSSNSIDEELPGLIRQLTALLRDPFGKAQQETATPYPTPPSNPDLLFWFRV